MRIAVIGRGLIGSAAARHLALANHDPVLIGPGEPDDKRSHYGVFSSHYDEGRITRKNATEPFWSEASISSIARYRDIEVASGVRFFVDVGALMMGPEDSPFIRGARATASRCGVPHRDLDATDLTRVFPYLSVSRIMSALWERSDAGYISPRRMVAAQTKAAISAGAAVIDAPVRALDDRADGVAVHLDCETLMFDRVLVAAGAMSDHVLGRPARLRVFARTVALFQVSGDEAARLASMPSIVMRLPGEYYLLPPIRYPDGRYYLKLGGDPVDVVLHTPEEIGEWFRSGGNPAVRDHLESLFRTMLPAVKVENVLMDACVTTWSDSGRPEIAALSPRLAIATAGCGEGAKCSDELGRRGAVALLEECRQRIAS